MDVCQVRRTESGAPGKKLWDYWLMAGKNSCRLLVANVVARVVVLRLIRSTGGEQPRRRGDEGKAADVQACRALGRTVPEERQSHGCGLPAVRGVQTHTWRPSPCTPPAAKAPAVAK